LSQYSMTSYWRRASSREHQARPLGPSPIDRMARATRRSRGYRGFGHYASQDFGSRRLGAALHQLGHHAQQVAIEDGVNQIALRGHERRVRPMLFVCTAQCSQSAGVRTWRCTLRDIRNTLSVRASRLTHRRTSTGVAGARQGRRRALLLVGPAVSPTSEPAGAP